MSQENYILFIIQFENETREFMCYNEPEIASKIQESQNENYISREIKFFKANQYNEKISKLYNKKYLII